MARVELHTLIKHLSGDMDGIVFRRSVSGRFYISRRPDMSSVQWSPAQRAHRLRFRAATAYASAALADPQLKAHYQARAVQEKSRPYDLAVSDAFKGIDLLKEKSRQTPA